MSLDPKHVGRKYGPTVYQVGLEKLREFSYAVAGGPPSDVGFMGGAPKGLHPYLHDAEASQQGPHGSVIAFPTFPVTFAMAPFGMAVGDPAFGIDLNRVVHGEQEFELFDVVRPGDTITSTGVIQDIYAKAGKDFLVVVTESINQHGKRVVKGTWTAVIR